MWPRDEMRPHGDQARFEEEFLALNVLPESDREDEVQVVIPVRRRRQLSPLVFEVDDQTPTPTEVASDPRGADSGEQATTNGHLQA